MITTFNNYKDKSKKIIFIKYTKFDNSDTVNRIPFGKSLWAIYENDLEKYISELELWGGKKEDVEIMSSEFTGVFFALDYKKTHKYIMGESSEKPKLEIFDNNKHILRFNKSNDSKSMLKYYADMKYQVLSVCFADIISNNGLDDYLKFKPDLNISNDNGNTILMYACLNNENMMYNNIKKILKYGVNITQYDGFKRSAIIDFVDNSDDITNVIDILNLFILYGLRFISIVKENIYFLDYLEKFKKSYYDIMIKKHPKLYHEYKDIKKMDEFNI